MNKPIVESNRKLMMYLRRKKWVFDVHKNFIRFVSFRENSPSARIAFEDGRNVQISHVNQNWSDDLFRWVVPPNLPWSTSEARLTVSFSWKFQIQMRSRTIEIVDSNSPTRLENAIAARMPCVSHPKKSVSASLGHWSLWNSSNSIRGRDVVVKFWVKLFIVSDSLRFKSPSFP